MLSIFFLRRRPARAGLHTAVLALLALALLWAGPAARAATYNVSSVAQLDAAVASSQDGDTIQFAAGIYHLDKEFVLRHGLNLTGAGAGNTILDGGGGPILFVFSNVSAALSGLTLQNGSGQDGGAVSNDGTVTLTGCALTGNTATGDVGGGALYNGGTATLVNCSLNNNSADNGIGGAFLNDGTATLTGCTLNNNTATNARGGGGAINNQAGPLVLTGCTLTGNSTTGDGGAIISFSGLTLTGCTLARNSADSSGAIFNISTMTLTNCALAGNSATGADGLGGAVDNDGTATFVNCSLTGNRSSGNDSSGASVGAVYSSRTLTLTGCTFSGNTASNSEVGALFNGGTATLTNDIFYADITETGVEFASGGTLSASYCDIDGGYSGTGDFNADPRFVRAPGANGSTDPGDLHLQAGSPCIGVGTTNAPSYTSFDEDGVPRANPPTVGAYEGYKLVVTNIGASGAGSLAAAIASADAAPDAVITFDPTVFGSSPQTIAPAGTLSVTGRAAILGPAGGVVLDGSGQHGIITVASGASLFLSNLSLQNGNSGSSGGAIENDGTLTLTDCALTNNAAYRTGGAISNGNYATLTLTECTLSGNSAGHGSGGGLYNSQGGSASLTDDILWNNSAFNESEISDNYGGVSPTYCDIQDGYIGTGNFNADPRFVNGASAPYDLHLQAGSPCIGAGTTNAPAYTAFDLDGIPRANPPTVGAYEGYEVLVTHPALASSLNPSIYGQVVTFTAVISNPAAGDPIPTGTVQFTVNGAALGAPVPLDGSGTARVGTTTLPIGALSIQATYSGDGGHMSGGTSLMQTVNPASVTGVAVGWGTQTAPLTAGAALPWLGISKLIVTVNAPAGLAPGDISLTGKAVASYGPVTVSAAGSVYTLTLAKPITTPDRLTLTIGNAGVNDYSASFTVLPGDVNSDGAVNASDMTLVKNAIGGAYKQTDDIDGSGVVDITDYNDVRARVGTKLP